MGVIAYHFVGDTLRDGRPIPPDGEWLIHVGEVAICESGLHASRDPFHALIYAPGNTLCKVECKDIVEEYDNKLVCRRRKIIKRKNIKELLIEFAYWCASEVDDPDTSWAAETAATISTPQFTFWTVIAASRAEDVSIEKYRSRFNKLVSEFMEKN